MSDHSDNHECLLEHYKALRERFTSQGDRLWKRFHFFLTVDSAFVGAFLARANLQIPEQLTVLGLLLSILWFIIGAQDLWFYENSRKKLNDFKKSQILPQLPTWRIEDEERSIPLWSWRKPLCFKIPKIGVTTFASIIPLLFVGVWGILKVCGP